MSVCRYILCVVCAVRVHMRRPEVAGVFFCYSALFILRQSLFLNPESLPCFWQAGGSKNPLSCLFFSVPIAGVPGDCGIVPGLLCECYNQNCGPLTMHKEKRSSVRGARRTVEGKGGGSDVIIF